MTSLAVKPPPTAGVRTTVGKKKWPGTGAQALKLRKLRIASASQWILDAAERLGLNGITNGRWSKAQLRGMGQIAKFLVTGDTLPAMLLNDTMRQLTIIDGAMQQMQAQLDEPAPTAESVMANVAAANALAQLAKVHKEKTMLALELQRVLNEGKPEEKKRNLPPTVALQVNVAGGANPSPPPAMSANIGTTVRMLPPQPPST